MISDDDRRRLLAIARRALEAKVRQATPPAVDLHLDVETGAFVTISRHGELRGCLGRLTPDLPLPHLVTELARAVADSDPRFTRVLPSELDDITIEISVLTPEREIESLAEIEVGRHGVIVEQDMRRGLLLPQVAIEQRWDRETFLNHTCLKAGLPADAWKRGARILVFEAEVFGDHVSRRTH